MAAHCCYLPVKVDILSKQWGETGSSPRGAQALKGPKSHAAMPTKQQVLAVEPKQDLHFTSIHPSIDPTPGLHPSIAHPPWQCCATKDKGCKRRIKQQKKSQQD